MSNLVEDDIVQLKHGIEVNNVYCNNFNFTIHRRHMNCPPFPFAVPVGSEFNVGRLSYSTSEMMVQGELPLVSEATHRINFHLMPDAHNYDFIERQQKVRKYISGIDDSFLHDFNFHNEHIQKIPLLLIVLSIIAIMAIIYHRRKIETYFRYRRR